MTRPAPTCTPRLFSWRDPRTGLVHMREGVLIHDARHGRTWAISDDYVCDGASVPRLAWLVVNRDEASAAGWTSHDLLYSRNGDVGDGRPPYTRAQADRLFDDFNVVDGVPALKCRVFHRGVRLGGWLAWWKHSRRLARERAAAAGQTDGARVQRAMSNLPEDR